MPTVSVRRVLAALAVTLCLACGGGRVDPTSPPAPYTFPTLDVPGGHPPTLITPAPGTWALLGTGLL